MIEVSFMKKFFKTFFKVLGITIGVVLLLAVALFAFLTITEFKPADIEPLTVEHGANEPTAFSGDSFRVLSWNIGYAALGKESDFFMDGGTQTRPDSKDIITKNLAGIRDTVERVDADFCLLQEADSGSTRSYNVQEVEQLAAIPAYRASAYALNYKCPFVPIPWPPLGKVNSGLLTLSKFEVESADRISLPCPFSWPLSTANLKRCLLVTRVPIEGTDRELVLVNLHLEAYDDGEGKIAQTKQLLNFLDEEFDKGNYVLAGGDWNQVFPDTLNTYANAHPDLWTPGVLSESDLSTGWRFAWDATTGTCRLLNQPYDPTDEVNTQYYVIDGFLVSPNLEIVSVETLKEDFAFSDHNPVLLELRFAAE